MLLGGLNGVCVSDVCYHDHVADGSCGSQPLPSITREYPSLSLVQEKIHIKIPSTVSKRMCITFAPSECQKTVSQAIVRLGQLYSTHQTRGTCYWHECFSSLCYLHCIFFHILTLFCKSPDLSELRWNT